MDRRAFIYTALTGAATAAAAAGAQSYAGAPQATAPTFPPPDARSVWLVGDSAPPDLVATSARLARLAAAEGHSAQDSYLTHGAVAELEADMTRLLGKEDCAFFVTGTQANNVAVRLLCGDDHHALCHHESHLYWDESDSAQRLSELNLVPLGAGRPYFTAEEAATAIEEAEKGPYPLKVGAIAIESPVRRQEGRIVPTATVSALAALAKAHGAGLHLDAARLLLAPPSVDVKAYVAPFDTVYVSLYKYLDAPFGAVLAGSKTHIAKARELRHLYGGLIYGGWASAMLARDSLSTFSARIARAHETAERLSDALQASNRFRRRPDPDASNIFMLETTQADASAAFERGRAAGVRLGRWKDGAMPVYINETINRRPAEEYTSIFLG